MFYLTFGVVAAFVALRLFYLVAESTSLLGAIARNTEAVRRAAERHRLPASREPV